MIEAIGKHFVHETAPAADLHFRTGQIDEAVALVKKFHYSRRAPGSVVIVGTFHTEGGLFGDFGPAVAAVFFSSPPTRWSEDVLELSRLVRSDSCRVPLTRLISLACKRLKIRGVDLLVSFADAGHGHHGGVYQACGWNYDGQRDVTCDGCMVNSVFVPGRTCNARWGTRSPNKLRDLLKQDVQPHYDVGKHLYWRALSHSGQIKAERLKLKQIAYPKPGLNSFNSDNREEPCQDSQS